LKKILFPLLGFFLLFPMAYACGADTKCETLTKDEATAIVNKLDPNLSASDVRISPAESMWEVTVNTGEKKVLAYINRSKRYILLGDLLNTKDLMQKRMMEKSLSEVC
jgi:hypothetical protein